MLPGTLERTPPPFFRQGTSARTKLVLFSLLAVGLMVADARWRLVDPVRTAIAGLLLPAQRVLLAPMDGWRGVARHFQDLDSAHRDAEQARAALAAQALVEAQVAQLRLENDRLRSLLDLRASMVAPSRAAQVLFESADPYARRVVIDRGSLHGVLAGSPVVVRDGVLGQVTRVQTLSAEVTLLTDREAAIAVLNARTGARSAAFGGVDPGMELRYVTGEFDIQPGDLMTTSGLDGVYPPGLPVARVARVERRPQSGFARILLQPQASADGVRHVLVLEPLNAVGKGTPAPPQAGP